MKNHFYFPYAGNKRNEAEKIYNYINFENVEYIIEPYCGSCAISYYIWLKNPTYKFILNDNNNYLKEMYLILIDDVKLKEFEDKINNEIIPKISKNKIDYVNYLKDKNIYTWFIANKFYNIRAGLYPSESKFKNIDLNKYGITEFFKKADITFTNIEGIECYKKYKDNVNNLLLLDPPYLSTHNHFYSKPDVNIYEYLFNNNIDSEKAKIYLILENMWIIKLLFDKYPKFEYAKIYEMSKKKTTHIIITKNNI